MDKVEKFVLLIIFHSPVTFNRPHFMLQADNAAQVLRPRLSRWTLVQREHFLTKKPLYSGGEILRRFAPQNDALSKSP